MFRHILVPLDLGAGSSRAIAIAVRLAVDNHARVTLLHVVHRISGIPATELRGFYRRLEDASRKNLARVAAAFTRRGLRVRGVVLLGTPAREIARFAAAKRVGLIVMGSHRVDPGRVGRGLGTTSYKVGILCSCPILLVK
jgi:nucleotide-binding universal stress UspA family protein